MAQHQFGLEQNLFPAGSGIIRFPELVQQEPDGEAADFVVVLGDGRDRRAHGLDDRDARARAGVLLAVRGPRPDHEPGRARALAQVGVRGPRGHAAFRCGRYRSEPFRHARAVPRGFKAAGAG